MALSESRRKANDKYIAEHYSRIALSMPKEEAEALRTYCKDHGLTVAGFIRGLIKVAIGRDTPRGDMGDNQAVSVTPKNSREK